MKIRTCAALLLAVGLPTAVFAVDYPEIEPNETKAQALTNGAFTLAAGDSVSGSTTGTSTLTAGAASADTFLVKTTPAALGIYRHRLVITTPGTAGHTGTIRGLASTSTGATAGGDSTFQTSSSSTTPGRMNQWYGFGKEEQIYYRVTGGSTTTADYTSTLSTDVITPAAFATSPEAGTMTIFHDVATNSAYDRDMFLFDSNFNPIAGIDDGDAIALSVTLSPGTYYIGYGRWQTAAGPTAGNSIIQGTYQSGTVLDFADAAATNSASVGTQPVTLNISAVNGTHSASDIALGSYDMAWFSFTVDPAISPTNPSGVGAASPNVVINDGTGTTTLTVTVTPGTNPTSSFNTTGSVTIDGSGLGLGTITLLDDGVAPDAVAGDNVFSADATVPNGSAGGAYTLPFTITDDQSRSGTGNINLTVTTPPPGCASGLATLSFSGVSGNGPVGDAANSLVAGDFGVAGSVNEITITGRYTSVSPSWRSEARIRMIAPDGSIYDTAAFAGAPGSAGEWDVLGTVVTLGGLEDGTGTWSFEFFESFNDSGVTPDATWVGVCFAANLTSTNPTATGVATPASAINDGTGTTTLSVTVNPGAEPLSTFLSTGSVTVDGSGIGAGTVTLLDNGVAPDAVAGDLIFTADAAVANGTPAGSTPLPFFVVDDQGRSVGGNIAFTVTTPPPACPAGLATLSFNNVQGDGPVGDVDNSIVTGDFGVAGQVNLLRMSGRMFSNALFNTEARVRVTAPDGSIYLVQPFPSGTQSSPRDLISIEFPFSLEDGTGTWTFEFYESFNDGATPDVVWSDVCFAADLVSSPITATDTASSPVVRDGVATSTLTVTVTPGAVPNSTGLSVVVDDSSVGGSGTLTLLDDGVAPDAVAGDNIFSGSTTVAYTTALGTATLPYTVSDDQARSFVGSLNFTVAEATGACCTTSGCVVTTIGDCLDVQGGTFAGTGTACSAPTALTTDGAGAFEDISATGTLIVDLEGDDDATAAVALPFTFNYFGNDYTSVNVSTNGNAQFGASNSTAFSNGTLPSAGLPNDALYVLWDDHDFDLTGHAYTQLLGTIGVDARFIIQWNNVGQYNIGATPLDANTYQIALFEDGSFEFRYLTLGNEAAGSSGAGDTTTIGFENADGTLAYQSSETRDSLIAQLPVSLRANSTVNDTGICGSGCPACAADYDNNGGVDGGDLAAFFADFEAGETCADVDGNGGVDGGDLGYFFFVFEQGGCE